MITIKVLVSGMSKLHYHGQVWSAMALLKRIGPELELALIRHKRDEYTEVVVAVTAHGKTIKLSGVIRPGGAAE